MAFDIARFIARFIEEGRDLTGKLSEGIVALEKTPYDAELLNSIFRSAHTIKGSSRMMKLTPISDVAHKMEDVLGALRDGRLSFSAELGDLLFKGVDAVSAMIEAVAAGTPLDADNTALCDELKAASEGGAIASRPACPPGTGLKASPPVMDEPPARRQPDALPRPPATSEVAGVPETAGKVHLDETIRVNADKLDELTKLMGELISTHGRLKYRQQEIRALQADTRGLSDTVALMLAQVASISDPELREHLSAMTLGLSKAAHELRQKVSRVSYGFKDDANVNQLLSAELQEKAMMLRMVPLSLAFDTLHRVPRDLARSLGKEVALEVEGGEIELDKKIVEKLSDPLIHMIRNAVDHGIETPEQRQAAGKPAKGSLTLTAACEGGHAVIRLSDDGGGLNLQRIRDKAVMRKLVTPQRVATLSEAELTALIFEPGFSTSDIITDVSGRGVGMDVVKKNIIEDLKGSIVVNSEAGKGTTFTIRLPLSLAIVPILIVGLSSSTVALPSPYVEEILSFSDSEIIDVVDKRAIRLRSELIPVMSIDELLGNNVDRASEARHSQIAFIVRMGNDKLGLLADELIDGRDVVIKPLPPHLKNIKKVSGVMISANNEIINILHVPALFESSKQISQRPGAVDAAQTEAIHILVVDDSINTREIEKSILESYGYRVTVAEDGLEAIEKVAQTKYDLVVTDVDMPRLDGFSLTQRLRQDAAYRNTPIIIVTSREKEEDKRRGIQVGADAYIVKGAFDQGNLIDTIRNLIG